MRIRPALQVYDASAVLRENVEDAWHVAEITNDSLTLRSRDTGHTKTIGLDHIHNYMADPEGERKLGTSGTLVMNVQLLLYDGELLAEPVAPPGTALKSFAPARPRQGLLAAAAKMRAAANLEKARKEFAWSAAGVAASDRAFDEFPASFASLEATLAQAGQPVEMKVKRNGSLILLGAVGWWVSFYWRRAYANTLDDSRLDVTKWDGHPEFPGLIVWERPHKISNEQYTYGLAGVDQPRWLSISHPSTTYTTQDLAQKVLTGLLEAPNDPKRRR